MPDLPEFDPNLERFLVDREGPPPAEDDAPEVGYTVVPVHVSPEGEKSKMRPIGDLNHEEIAELIDEEAEKAAAAKAEKEEKAPEPRKKPDTGASDPFCPCCRWDTRQPHPDRPTDTDRRIFFESLESGQPFVKKFRMAQGKIEMVVRIMREAESYFVVEDFVRETAKMTPRQISIARQRYEDMQNFLHLVRYRGPGGAKPYDAPDGISPEASPGADTFLISEEVWQQALSEQTGLMERATRPARGIVPPSAIPLLKRAVQRTLAVYNALVHELSNEATSEEKEASRNF